jgi:hypothetical protein
MENEKKQPLPCFRVEKKHPLEPDSSLTEVMRDWSG